VRVRSHPRRALADEMPRLRRLVAADGRTVAGPFDPGVGRRLQIGTADRCSNTSPTATSAAAAASIRPSQRFTADLVYPRRDLCFHADPPTARV